MTHAWASGGSRHEASCLARSPSTHDQSLTFDLWQSTGAQQFHTTDIFLVGAGKTLAFDTPANPGTDWTAYSVILNEAGWRHGVRNTGWWQSRPLGAAATQADMLSVLGALQAIWIRGEYSTTLDFGGLDNVVLNGASIPADRTAGAVEGAARRARAARRRGRGTASRHSRRGVSGAPHGC